MRMPWVIMRGIVYKRVYPVTGVGVLNGFTHTPIAKIYPSVLCLIILKVYIVKGNTRCKKGYYKVMMFVTGKKKPTLLNSGDFHFYKQHGLVEYKPKEGDTKTSIAKFFKVSPRKIPKVVVGKIMKIRVSVFSHKRGWATGPLLKDAKGKVIKDPRKANRNYGGLNYNTYCSSFCVKNRGINVGKVRSNLRKKSV